MHRSLRAVLAAALTFGLAAAVPASNPYAAAGGGSSSSSGSSSGSSSSVATEYVKAKAKVDKKDYRGAIAMLEKIVRKNAKHADALNLLGYSHRKLGRIDEALEYYGKALKVNPKHLGANEYLGELYLEMNDLAKAEERRAVLAKACKSCEELEDLDEAIAAFKAKSS